MKKQSGALVVTLDMLQRLINCRIIIIIIIKLENMKNMCPAFFMNIIIIIHNFKSLFFWYTRFYI